MPGIQKSVRLPEETLKEIQRMVRETGMDFSAVTKDLLTEAIKIRRCPGIRFHRWGQWPKSPYCRDRYRGLGSNCHILQR